MDYAALIIFLALYYLRPQEWFSDFSNLHPVQILSVLAIWSLVKTKRVAFTKLLATPLDWLMVAYFIWTLICGFTPRHTFSGIQAVILFYFVGVCSLDSIPKIKGFLGWWCIFIFIVAALAVGSTYGFDPLGSNDITTGPMKGRLILNLSIFNNPNTLAHSIISAIPLFYYLFYWRQITKKIFALLLIVPLYCIFLTQSKGAFLCGFATLLATLTFGRSRIWQIIIVIAAIGFGYGALYTLPRMNELHNSKTDPAIQGRVAALNYGLTLMRTNFFGIGLGNFEGDFFKRGPLEKHVKIRILPGHEERGAHGTVHELNGLRVHVVTWKHYLKATHGAYNQNGAELGYVGLYLFIGILYCCIRTLLLVKSKDDDEERIRRALFALVVAYAASSWMVDFCYRPTFFMMVAAVSAFHRHLLRKQGESNDAIVEPPVVDLRPWIRRLPPIAMPGISLRGLTPPLPAGQVVCLPAAAAVVSALPAATTTLMAPGQLPTARSGAGVPSAPRSGLAPDKVSTIKETLRKKFIWDRLGIMDFIIIGVLMYVAILYWEHLIATM